MRRALVVLDFFLLLSIGQGCASLDLRRTSPEGGTFRSSAWALTFLSKDVPAPALSMARANVADSERGELTIQEETLIPHLGPFDWILDVFSVRYAKVSGTWVRPDL